MNQKKILLIAGVGVGIATTILGLNHVKRLQLKMKSFGRSNALSKAEVMNILKELDQEYSPIYINISRIVKILKIQSEYQITEKQIKDQIDYNQKYCSQMTKIKKKICEKYSTCIETLQKSIENIYKLDRDVQSLLEMINHNIDCAYKGIEPTTVNLIPKFLTADLCANIIEEMYAIEILHLNERIIEISQRGVVINMQNKEFINEIRDTNHFVEVELCKMMKKYGLDGLEKPGKLIINNARKMYSGIDPLFRKKVESLDCESKILMQKCMQGGIPDNDIRKLKSLIRMMEDLDINTIDAEENDTHLRF